MSELETNQPAPTGVVTLDTENLVDDGGEVRPEVIHSFGGCSEEALLTLHGVIRNELGNRGISV